MINPRPEYQEIGEHIAHLLASEHCPQRLREMIEGYLSDLYGQTNMLKPEIVRSLFPYLMFASESANGDRNGHAGDAAKANGVEEAAAALSAQVNGSAEEAGDALSAQVNGNGENAAASGEGEDAWSLGPIKLTY